MPSEFTKSGGLPADTPRPHFTGPAGRRRYERRRQNQDAALMAAALHLNLQATNKGKKGGFSFLRAGGALDCLVRVNRPACRQAGAALREGGQDEFVRNLQKGGELTCGT